MQTALSLSLKVEVKKSFSPKIVAEQYESSSRKCSACALVFENLISIKRLNVADAKVILDEKPRIEIKNDGFSLYSRNNLFFLRATKFEVNNTAEETLQLW